MPIDHRELLLNLLARIDQQLAEADALTTMPADDDMLQRITATLAELREAREDVEEKLRAESMTQVSR